MKKHKKIITIQVKLPQSMKERFYEKALYQSQTPSRLMRRWIEIYLDEDS